MTKTKHNPERRAWKGRSYQRGGERVTDLRDKSAQETDNLELFRKATEHQCHDLRSEIEVLWKFRHENAWGSTVGQPDGTKARLVTHGAIRHRISMLRYYEQGIE